MFGERTFESLMDDHPGSKQLWRLIESLRLCWWRFSAGGEGQCSDGTVDGHERKLLFWIVDVDRTLNDAKSILAWYWPETVPARQRAAGEAATLFIMCAFQVQVALSALLNFDYLNEDSIQGFRTQPLLNLQARTTRHVQAHAHGCILYDIPFFSIALFDGIHKGQTKWLGGWWRLQLLSKNRVIRVSNYNTNLITHYSRVRPRIPPPLLVHEGGFSKMYIHTLIS